jgi:UPF0755 protein
VAIRKHIPLSSDELLFGSLLFFLITFIVAESRWSRLYNVNAVQADDPVHIYLEDRIDLSSLSDILVDSGLVRNKEELHWAANLMGWRFFREGHYVVDQGYTYDTFLSKLARGIQDPVSVTILPGKTKGEIARAVSEKMQFDSLTFRNTIEDSVLLDEMNLQPENVIGKLYPNTYAIFWTLSSENVFRKIIDEFNKAVVKRYRNRFDELGYSVEEIITLASIVEWEGKNVEELSTISGLYWNRLERGMRLQADPTVNFAVGKRRRLLYKDYQVDHPYNTYNYRGLPPGPITNPGLNAIKATVFPEEHNYLYMVASPDGSHAFSETYEEHNRKSAKWRKWLQEQYRIKEQQQHNSQKE